MLDIAHSDDDDAADLNTAPPPPLTVGAVLAHEALTSALTRKSRALLERASSVLIVKVPDIAWAELIAEAATKIANKSVIKPVADLNRAGKSEIRAGGDALRYLQHGRSVVLVCHDPEALLDETVLAAADATVVIPPATPALLRKVILRVTKQSARGVTTEMADQPLAIILSAIRPGLAARDCVANLARASVKRVVPRVSSVPLLTALPITASLRRWTDETLAELAAVKTGNLPADQLVFAVLEGLPGTGKTLIAESLARTAGWEFVGTSVGAWFTQGDGALGGVARNLKTFIDTVLAAEPCVGFLDEIESLPDRATMDNRDRTWWTPIVTLFLVEIDRVKRSGKQVLLLGGTNFIDRLDDALIRPGRLQQRVTVLPPQTTDEVVAVLRFYLGGKLGSVDLAPLAKVGLGATPATIEGWVKSARAAARAQDRALNARDILDQILPKDDRRAADTRSIALHEAGHALVAHRLGHRVETVSIVQTGDSGGHTRSSAGTMIWDMQHIRNTATIMLAGRAADIVIGNGANSGAEGDLQAATRLLIDAYARQGLSTGLLYGPAVSTRPNPSTVSAVETELSRLLARAVGMIEADRDLALKLADRLIAARVLTGADVARILGNQSETSQSAELAALSSPAN